MARAPWPSGIWPRGPLLLCLVLLGACSGNGSSAARSALLITLDTTRADALGCYGNPKGTTPNLDRLASEGVLFERAYSVAPLTLPSHTSMLTGLYPPRHTVRLNGVNPVPASAETLAELAARAGVATAAFVSAAVLDPHFGLDQGFARFDGPAHTGGSGESSGERSAQETVERAAAWLEERDGAPFFLWVHLFDPHAPYAPPPELLTGLLANEPYLAEVAAADRAVGRLLAALERSGAAARTSIVVVADHGEALGAHGEATHGSQCYDPTLHVPLIVRPAAGGRRGEHDAHVVSVVDVFATLASALGLTGIEAGDGHDLLASDGARESGVYCESYSGFVSLGWSPLAGWIDAGGKYLHSSAPEFYDLARDPGETRNLFEHGAAVEPYRDAIARVADAPALQADARRVDDRELLAQIRALGYADAARDVRELPHPLAPSDRPAPGQMTSEEATLHRAGELVGRGACDQARPLLEGLVAANPLNLFALDMLAHCLAQGGKRSEAIEVLRRLLREHPPWPDSYHRLGTLLVAEGRQEEALEVFAAGLSVDPGHGPCLLGLTRLLEQLGRTEEAARYRAQFGAKR